MASKQPTGPSLPLPHPPTASTIGRSLNDSEHEWRNAPRRVSADAPHIVIFMTDDAGFANPECFGGPVRMPTMARVAGNGVAYNRFHTTAMCSPTRACVLTGRNHHAVGFGQIPEYSNDFDGYVGEIPRSAATIAEVLKGYGYATGAFGKWHNTPIDQVTKTGPFDRWPTGHGFDYFYGFVAAETSQYEPRLFENTTAIEPPEEYTHLTEDMATKTIQFIRDRQNAAPEQPMLIYFTPGAVHGPHHVPLEWADRYAGEFDDGWEVLRERTFELQKKRGWIPEDADLTPIVDTMQKWEDVPEEERAFQTRLMEVYAGFLEHADAQYGKVLDELERLDLLDNTLVFYINSDNGASAEGQFGTLAEILCQNGMKVGPTEQIEVLDRDYGGLDALGTSIVDNMYHAGWAWAGDTPFKSTKLIAAHFGGTRTPLAVQWPKGFAPDPSPRSQFHHVIDIAATIYDVVGIDPPASVDGVAQDPIHGTSMLPSFHEAEARSGRTEQYFEIMGSRGIYKDGWFAGAFGPRTPWDNSIVDGLIGWEPDEDQWELYDLTTDYSQAHDLAVSHPDKLQELRDAFDEHAEANNVFPIGGGLLTSVYRPDLMKTVPVRKWVFHDHDDRIAEAVAPKFLSTFSSRSVVSFSAGPEDSGVLFCIGGITGGFTVYVDEGRVRAEYNTGGIYRYKAAAEQPMTAGDHELIVDVAMEGNRFRCPAEIMLSLDGSEVASVTADKTMSAMFSFSETFDVGKDLGSPVALDYGDRAPFPFSGSIHEVRVAYL